MGTRTLHSGVGGRKGQDGSAFDCADWSQAEWAVDKDVDEVPADMLGQSIRALFGTNVRAS
jgi:hypothetical protein